MSAEASSLVSETTHRVDYSETDQMGVVYHARYLPWLDVARTEFLRRTGLTYRELEVMGFRLAVGELSVRYRQAARYDDRVRIRCWLRDKASRRVTFGYAIENADDGRLLVTAWTSMMVLDAEFRLTRLPAPILDRLPLADDVVRL